MPLMDGIEFVERLRQMPQYTDSPVVFITGRTTVNEQDRAASLGVEDYFIKPVEPELLIRTLDRHCLRVSAPGVIEAANPALGKS